MPRTLKRPTAVALIAGFFAFASSEMLLAAAPSSLAGRVMAQNGADPRPGVVVTLVEPGSERAYRSSPTDARGAFAIDAAPAGSYALVVEAPEGAFLAARNLELAPGVNRPLSLALKPGKQGEAPPSAPPPTAAKPEGLPTWAKWVIAGGIIVGGAIVVDAVAGDSNEASQF
jgi:hypothetical protein